MTITSIGKSLGLAATKRIRAKKRKLVKQFGNKPVMHPFKDPYGIKVSELYDHNPSMIRINYKSIFPRKYRSKYYKG